MKMELIIIIDMQKADYFLERRFANTIIQYHEYSYTESEIVVELKRFKFTCILYSNTETSFYILHSITMFFSTAQMKMIKFTVYLLLYMFMYKYYK